MALSWVIAGGGTGGHVYPALAVASELAAHVSHLSVLYVGAKGEIAFIVAKKPS